MFYNICPTHSVRVLKEYAARVTVLLDMKKEGVRTVPLLYGGRPEGLVVILHLTQQTILRSGV